MDYYYIKKNVVNQVHFSLSYESKKAWNESMPHCIILEDYSTGNSLTGANSLTLSNTNTVPGS